MRYLMMIKMDESKPFGEPPPSLYQAIAEFGDESRKNGTLLEEGGLMPSAAGALVRLAGGRVTVVDGPFTEAKELIGGYAMFQLRSKEEAVEMGRRFMELHAEHWPAAEAVCEIRQVMEFGGS